jgi:hypothetical protein
MRACANDQCIWVVPEPAPRSPEQHDGVAVNSKGIDEVVYESAGDGESATQAQESGRAHAEQKRHRERSL